MHKDTIIPTISEKGITPYQPYTTLIPLDDNYGAVILNNFDERHELTIDQFKILELIDAEFFNHFTYSTFLSGDVNTAIEEKCLEIHNRNIPLTAQSLKLAGTALECLHALYGDDYVQNAFEINGVFYEGYEVKVINNGVLKIKEEYYLFQKNTDDELLELLVSQYENGWAQEIYGLLSTLSDEYKQKHLNTINGLLL